MRKLLGLLVLILFTWTGFACTYENPVIEFEDPNLEIALRELLNKSEGDIDARDARSITTLDLLGRNISNLNGLEYFTNLEVLILEDNFVSDLRPLRDLKKLESLNLRNNEITNLNDIYFQEIIDLPLTSLSLRHNVVRDEFDNQTRISDISLLANFSDLEYLDLQDNHIKNIEALKNLSKLTYLNISQNDLEDKSVLDLENLIHLQSLNLRQTGVTNLDVLANFTDLEYLNIHSNTELTSIAFISSLTKLETLIAQNVPIGNQIGLLEDHNQLLRLNLQNTNINDLSVIIDLMEAGALQDDPLLGQYAEVNIAANPLTENDYEKLVPFWDNINSKVPAVLPLGEIFYPLINEIMASNDNSLEDYQGENVDWIELYNPTDTPMDISGYYLSDNIEELKKWAFPENTIIPAEGYLLVYASGKDVLTNDQIHTNFNIARDGEELVLTAKDGQQILDYVPDLIVPRDYSYGRKIDGEQPWLYFDIYQVSPGLSNNDYIPYSMDDSIVPTDFSFNTETFDRFFNDDIEKNIIIKISEYEWNRYDELMIRYSELFNGELRSDHYAKADFLYEDEFGQILVGNVGFRTKGNMSRDRIQNDDGSLNMSNFKISFHESFGDENLDLNRKRTVFEVEELDMKWNRNFDPTYSTEKFSLDLMREFGVKSAYATLANLYIEIDGQRYFYGVYTVFEPIDELFLNKRFEEDHAQGDLFKSLWQQFGPASLMDDYPFRAIGIKDVSMNYRPTYDLKTNKDFFDRSKLEFFISQINDLNGIDFENYIEENFDVDQFLRYMAIGVLLGNPDDYRAMGNNYYLYQDPVSNQWSIIPYDYDHGLGQGWDGQPVFSNWTINNDIYEWGNLNAYQQGKSYANPLSHKILKIEKYQLQFEAYLEILIDQSNDYFKFSEFEAMVNNHQSIYGDGLNEAMMNLEFGFRNSEWYFQEKINSIQEQLDYYKNNPDQRPKW
ncbi:hypothetical protein HF295_08010 [Hujiaoplasma nucleasis]|uniref:LTD domain-containing protein n=1 Tax=Hujiaoplasma nucleasis TaxID=2725268 RepID=A0A7L6N3H2_9MOLU|nr:CotH kinase family protein [Hujiaoplasma nucleasis]QLY40800.1 hypothetical protein HF295_08010 [Hujiaoplasma nucleasis]